MNSSSIASSAMVAVVVALALITWCVSRLLFVRAREGFAQGPDTIFVSVPSYRDASCSKTVQDLFAKATFPKKVVVGMCVQTTGAENESCMPRGFKYNANVRVVRIPHTEAKGPTHARKMVANLYAGETWFLGIDSHTRFVKGWDVELLRQIAELPKDRSVLSHYPPSWDDDDTTTVPVICKVEFDDNGAPAHVATRLAPGVHYRTPYIGGGFVFGPGQIAHLFESLPHVWVPEEFVLSAKLYTNGYDVYTPSKSVVSHFYERKGEVRWHDDIPNWHAEQQTALKDVLARLNPDDPGFGVGFGTKRSLAEFYEWCGIDMRAKAVLPSADRFCHPGAE